jgi:hypothetical protein
MGPFFVSSFNFLFLFFPLPRLRLTDVVAVTQNMKTVSINEFNGKQKKNSFSFFFFFLKKKKKKKYLRVV